LLRLLFGEKPREWSGSSLETVQAMEKFIRMASDLAARDGDKRTQYQTYVIWAEGLLRSMDELEQSRYAAKRYASQISHLRLDDFSAEERLSYYRHVYFDKNAYIRAFALLDKLGTLLNELLRLQTERMKSRFSYFTVLRNMRQNGLHAELMGPLNELKERYQSALNRLRSRRNTEIHHMNAEMQDDLKQSLSRNGERRRLENIFSHMDDLDEAWKMVEGSLGHSFRYACRWLRRTK